MKIKFNGITETRRKGCPVCGKGGRHTSFVTSKKFYLPSGAIRHFRVGQITEVAGQDAEFLLSQDYLGPDGSHKKAFEKV